MGTCGKRWLYTLCLTVSILLNIADSINLNPREPKSSKQQGVGLLGATDEIPVAEVNSLTGILEMSDEIMKSMQLIMEGAAAIKASSSNVADVVSKVTDAALQLTVQMEKLVKLSQDLSMKIAAKPLEIVQPLIDSQIEMAITITTSITSLVEDISGLRQKIFGLLGLVPVAVAILASTTILCVGIILLIFVTWKKIAAINHAPNIERVAT